jgi:hypothetical protein
VIHGDSLLDSIRKNIAEFIETRKEQPVKKYMAVPYTKVLKAAGENWHKLRYEMLPYRGNVVFSGGYGYYNHFRFSVSGDYTIRFHNPCKGYYREAPPNESLLEYFRSLNLKKYQCGSKIYDKQRSFDLVGLQYLLPKMFGWQKQFLSGLEKYTVLAAHPAYTDEQNQQYFDALKSVIPDLDDNCELAVGYDLDDLIDKCDTFYTHDSASMVPAVIRGKRVAALSLNPWSDIVYAEPRVVPDEELSQFLNWWYNRVVIDIDQEGYEERIHHRIKYLLDGGSEDDLWRW